MSADKYPSIFSRQMEALTQARAMKITKAKLLTTCSLMHYQNQMFLPTQALVSFLSLSCSVAFLKNHQVPSSRLSV